MEGCPKSGETRSKSQQCQNEGMDSKLSRSISRFVILLLGSSTIQQRRKQFVGVSAELSYIFPTLIASIHQHDHWCDRPGAWSLILQQLLPTPLAAAILRYLPLAFDDLDLRGTVVEAEAPELVTTMKSLSVHIFNHVLCESDMEGSTEPERNSPICVSLSVSPDLTWTTLEQATRVTVWQCVAKSLQATLPSGSLKTQRYRLT